jgi:uncharacterized protein (TIGR00255 family)
MILNSMTGFARTDGEIGAYRWLWELRSVNGRGLEIRLRLPTGRDRMEQRARALIKDQLTRGTISATLSVRRQQAQSHLVVNKEALARLVDEVVSMNLAGLGQPRLDGLLNIRGIVEPVDYSETECETAALDGAVIDGLERAVADLVEARAGEGEKIAQVLERHVSRIGELSAQARACPATSAQAIFTKLTRQVEMLLERSAEFDIQRLHQEAALLATKADISEEIDRLDAHVSAARDLFGRGEAVGRRLDFLAQEFNREANTLCSKSNDTDLTAIGLELKAAIDQFREQVQNVE